MEILLQISSGRGPVECEWVVEQLRSIVCKNAQSKGLKTEIMSIEGAQKMNKKNICKSIQFKMSGDSKVISDFADEWQGTIKWVGKSLFRPRHKRKNWFVGVTIHQVAAERKYDVDQIYYEHIYGTGAGGQHVNKNANCVRAVHKPTGISVVCREQRSFIQNKKIAYEQILRKLAGLTVQNKAKEKEVRWDCHNNLERGNPVKVFYEEG